MIIINHHAFHNMIFIILTLRMKRSGPLTPIINDNNIASCSRDDEDDEDGEDDEDEDEDDE